MQRPIFSIFLVLVLCLIPNMYAQVTIGLDTAPNLGALLDLKEQDVVNGIANSSKGLGMPRVSLTTTSPAVGALAASIGSVGSWDETTHVGLVVYNIKEDVCATQPIVKGLYVWNGTQWEGLGVDTGTSVGVIEHPAKAGVYEAFTSALFGAAGRWMTTNLSAMAYDENKHSTDPFGIATEGLGSPRTLRGPNETMLVEGHFDSAYWGYPSAGEKGSMDSTEYSQNKALGYLYTWDAATAGKGGSTGLDSFGEAPNYEAGLPEGEAAGQQKRIQGICPAGWHLPSDYEWTLLENELQSYTSKYSSTNNIGGTVANVGSSSTAAIGIPMKSPCKATPTAPEDTQKGTSKSVSQGGFSALFAGEAEGSMSGSSLHTIGYFWSSSCSDDNENAWYRAVKRNDSGVVYRYDFDRNYMHSVRCKKDTP